MEAMSKKFEIEKTEKEWLQSLSHDAFRVLREHDTEPPFANPYDELFEPGIYECAGCGQPLFSSEAKFDSGSGWSSFSEPISPKAIGEDADKRFGMRRREIHCSRCGGHIGHVFPDGPKPTGLRYCTNSVALEFVPQEELKQD
ncbi:MAG TPA: peptide-methionine (R)-S-oxide reductase [Firmicutes bacterium]|nr:peptide-methionine (R)-S-oxide reductase [Bacillota bacterium]